ncbi:CaiB/BaiF CoA transferase family protein [Microbacterium sp. No. 7]|uniref:CaiB/BaiF CoA transferase family protein n=1 Tax=Microbacterium sp. No. 7 TaxID=1714373 RepID=UPI0006CF46CE|nr:CaiB/BaiF CoA-transferase family protein [Microbacterium sp. No. 7]ALJ19262.1 carnitine dehydratase [Microbacterium sp. No. 7]
MTGSDTATDGLPNGVNARGGGPLAGVRILEIGGVGPGPFACMLLADLGAEVVRIDRPAGYDGGAPVDPRFNLLQRGRRSIALDLKSPEATAAVLRLVREADIVVEGFRPGVAERLGLGPDACLEANPAVVYGRMTGWGQDGPMATEPGHDINYISLTGVLHAVGSKDGPPVPPLNFGGDFGGGALYLVMGVLAAYIESRRSGHGQVVDAAMVDGSASLMTLFYGLLASGYWRDERGVNRLDSGAPWYGVYRTADDRWLSIGSNETRFWNNALQVLGLDGEDLPDQHDQSGWPTLRRLLEERIRTRTRDEWVALAAGRDACLTPVLSMSEAPGHPHLRARGTFVEVEGIAQPAPAPRFSRTPGAIRNAPPVPGSDTDAVLADWGFAAEEIAALRDGGAIHRHK